MKKYLLKPGFEFLFSLGIIAVLALPQLLFAQSDKQPRKERKEIRITIKDNDTTFNGKNLKDLPPREKQEALAEINKMGRGMPFGDGRRAYSFKFKRDKDGRDSAFHFEIDSAHAIAGMMPRIRGFRMGPDGTDRLPQMRFRMDDIPFEGPAAAPRTFRKWDIVGKNTQHFNFTNMDKDGITTHISFRVADVRGPALKEVAGVTKADLDLQDLTLAPQFSAGKTTLSFTLPTKATADVQLTDSEGKTLWKDKAASATFTKSFPLGLNGIYHLIVKQGGKTAVKRIVKE